MVNKGGIGSESAGFNQNYAIWFDSSERLQGGFETTGGSNRWITSTNTYNDGQWHHGVVTFDNINNIVSLFVDGVEIGTLSTTSNPDNIGTQPLRIGGNSQSLVEGFFEGQLDEVGVWNRALSITETADLMNDGDFPTTGLRYMNTFDVDAKFAQSSATVNVDDLVILDGSGSTGSISSWSLVQTGGQPIVGLFDVPTKQFSKQFMMPDTDDTLIFTLTVRNDQTGKQNTDTMTVSKILEPPYEEYPISNINWFYDS